MNNRKVGGAVGGGVSLQSISQVSGGPQNRSSGAGLPTAYSTLSQGHSSSHVPAGLHRGFGGQGGQQHAVGGENKMSLEGVLPQSGLGMRQQHTTASMPLDGYNSSAGGGNTSSSNSADMFPLLNGGDVNASASQQQSGSSMRGGGVGLSMYGITGEGVSGGGGFDMSEFPSLTQGMADMTFGNPSSGNEAATSGINGGPSPVAALYGGERQLEQGSNVSGMPLGAGQGMHRPLFQPQPPLPPGSVSPAMGPSLLEKGGGGAGRYLSQQQLLQQQQHIQQQLHHPQTSQGLQHDSQQGAIGFTMQSEDFPALPVSAAEEGGRDRELGSGEGVNHQLDFYQEVMIGRVLGGGLGVPPSGVPGGVHPEASLDVGAGSLYPHHVQQQQQQQQQIQLQMQQQQKQQWPVKSGPSPGDGNIDLAHQKYGLRGLLEVIHMTDPDLNILALGTNLAILDLNLDSSDPLYTTFGSPWADHPAPCKPKCSLPREYCTLQQPTLKSNHLGSFQPETLFYIFYSMPQDVFQMCAAQELYRRDWRYHGEQKLWFKRAASTEGVSYIYFDPQTWERRGFTGGVGRSITAALMREDEIQVAIS